MQCPLSTSGLQWCPLHRGLLSTLYKNALPAPQDFKPQSKLLGSGPHEFKTGLILSQVSWGSGVFMLLTNTPRKTGSWSIRACMQHYAPNKQRMSRAASPTSQKSTSSTADEGDLKSSGFPGVWPACQWALSEQQVT